MVGPLPAGLWTAHVALVGNGELGSAMEQAGSALCTLGYLVPHTSGSAALDPLAALAGLGTVALQIGYLPTLYAAFNRREALITMLDSRAGVPSWGPELLARTHYGLGSGVSAVGELPELFEAWEQWSADVSESHTTYVPLIWFRSPRPLSSWVTAQLAVLDAAALYLALASQRERPHPSTPLSARRLHLPRQYRPSYTGFLSRRTPTQATGSRSRMRISSKLSSACAESTFRSSAPSRMRGRTSWVGGSTTRLLPTRWRGQLTRRQHCGRARGGTKSRRSPLFGRGRPERASL